MLIEMSGYRRVNYYELCRLCTSSEGNKTHIFKDEGRKRQLPTKIQACLRIQVSEEDSLPKIICNLCLDKLEGFFDFRTSCVKAEGMLESYATALRFNSDFKKEGKVYVRDVAYSKDGFEDDSINRLDVVPAPLPTTQEIHVQLQPAPQMKVSSKPQTLTSIPVPVSIDSLSSLVQAAAIQIVSQHDSDDARLHQYKVQMQPNADTTTHGDHNYSFQTSIQNSQITKQNQTLSSKNMKSASTQMDDHISNTVQEVEVDNDPLQSAITFTTNNSGQDVLLHFGLTKDKDDQLYQQSEENDSRTSMVHIREFLKMKPDEEITDEECDDKCENCGKQFSSDEDRINHSTTCSVDEKITNSYICDSCGKLFKRKEHLFQHKKLHTGERPFVCGHCGKTFSRKEHLVRHSVSHTGQKQYSCDLCGKSFGRKDNVRKHRKTHSLAGPFVCETCGKQFVVKPYFLMHKASHEDDPPHRCDVCQRTFSTKQYLMTHKLKHKEAPNTSTSLSLPQRSFQVVTTASSPIPNLVCSSTSPPRVADTYKRISLA
ncbi:uncharacterized protein [Halyomorpha halys]|uniref:uncharacterized protein isoform X1 n=1 Tax=Halyomorpha halys TaxID=286706 RepID=UPI0006D4F2A5|nr:zinc finger protein 271-like isoform X1 [Halyomorpha halys]